MRKYKQSLSHYEDLLELTQKALKDARDDINYFLAENTGRMTTHQSNKFIMSMVDKLIVLSYNEKHYESIIYNIVHGYGLEGEKK